MDALNFSCKGESHIAAGKVCQDYSHSDVYEDGTAIAIVCDGHGGKRYFRSDIGARIAAEVTEHKLKTFIGEAGASLLKDAPFTRRGTISDQITNHDFDKTSDIDRAFRQLFGSIIYEWNTEVLAHASQNPITESEKEGLEERWIKDFEAHVNLEKVYGCTLIAAVITPEFRLAFQIGDGKCFICDSEGNWSEPIPWDDRCFLNRTTSICDSGAIDEFRYCFDGTGEPPVAVILGSDGIDDSFGSEENQANFYVQILNSIAKSGRAATLSEIASTLPQLSKIGSRDDLSVAMIFDTDKVKAVVPAMLGWQIGNVRRMLAEESAKIAEASRIQESLESVEHPTRQAMIDLRYANADEKRAIDARTRLQGRLDSLLKELDAGDVHAEDAAIPDRDPATEKDAPADTPPSDTPTENTELNDAAE
ncbi:MAG: protein phosphatase 2C domain-containing protein [Muribaculaceae bacterium]|nr:protein phosphatase 2C domain-containing protein [Muribaculaceae bacterium]